MALRIGYCYVKCVEQYASIHFSDYTRPVRFSKMGVWSDNYTAAFFIGFNVTVFVADIEGIQTKLQCL